MLRSYWVIGTAAGLCVVDGGALRPPSLLGSDTYCAGGTLTACQATRGC